MSTTKSFPSRESASREIKAPPRRLRATASDGASKADGLQQAIPRRDAVTGDAPIRRRKAARTVNPQRKALGAQLARLEQQIRALTAERPAAGSPRERILKAMQAEQGELQDRLLAFRRTPLHR